jgi:hypothetical protein
MASRLVKQSSVKTVYTSSFSNSTGKIAQGDLCKKINSLLDQFNDVFGSAQGTCVCFPKIIACFISILGMISHIKKVTINIYLIVISLVDLSTNDENVKSFVNLAVSDTLKGIRREKRLYDHKFMVDFHCRKISVQGFL